MLAIILFFFSLLFSTVLGVPLNQRDVFNPHITNPHNGTVWVVGSKETVTWETADIPPDSQLTSPFGRVILGHLENDSLNLDVEHPLAMNFRLRSGKVTITVPDVPPRDDYIIVLMGDSGNASPAFVIASISGGGGSSSSSHSNSVTRTTTTNSRSTISTRSSTTTNGGSVTTTTTDRDVTSTDSLPVPTNTTPVNTDVLSTSSSTIAPESSNTSQSGTAAPVETGINGAWSMHNLQFTNLFGMVAAPLVLVLVV